MQRSEDIVFRTTEIPPLDEQGRNDLRAKVGLRGFLGRKPFTDILAASDYSHATEEFIKYDPVTDRGNYPDSAIPQAPTAGVGRRRAGVLGDIASSSY